LLATIASTRLLLADAHCGNIAHSTARPQLVPDGVAHDQMLDYHFSHGLTRDAARRQSVLLTTENSGTRSRTDKCAATAFDPERISVLL
jgi:hypothetical protein